MENSLEKGSKGNKGDDGPCTFRFVTYNVLSSHLASTAHHNNCKPEDLDHENRLQKLLAKLEVQVEDKAIIVLQEVSEIWANKLTVFFTNAGYMFYCRNYGGVPTGYMGVSIAFPLGIFTLVDMESKKIADTVYWPDDEKHIPHNGRVYSNKTLKSIDQGAKRWNSCIWAKLTHVLSKKTFCIATYHMPCVFWDPKVMNIHAGLCMRYVQEKSQGFPVLMGGDFNITPPSETYKMISTGEIDTLVESLFHNSKDLERISFADDKKKTKKNHENGKNGKKWNKDLKKTENKQNRQSKGQATGEKKKNFKTMKGGRKGPGNAEVQAAGEGDNEANDIEQPQDVRTVALPTGPVQSRSKIGRFAKINPMRSAYKVFMQKEPVFTNHSWTGSKDKAPFVDTLDYIFMTNEFEVLDIVKLYESDKEITGATLPDEIEPSDHLMLGATVKLI